MTLPTALASRQRRSIIDAATTGLGMARGAHISIKGNRFRLINAAGQEFLVPTAYLDVVVVDASDKTSKVYFEGEYDVSGSNDVPPTCYSDNGTGPSTQSMSPQAPTCAICPWNIVGSDQSKVTGKGIKACSDRKKVAIVIPDAPEVTVYELQIPPGSLSNLRAYSQWLGQQASGVEGRKLDIADLVTRIEFNPEKMGVMQFSAVAFADDDRTIQLIEYIDANRLADAAVGRADVAHDPEFVKNVLSGRTAAPALPPSAAPAPQQFQLPPRTAPAALPVPPPASAEHAAPAPAAPQPPKRRGRQPSTTPAAPPTAAAPFMAPAVPPAQPATATPPLAQNADLSVPDFLRRPANNGVGAPPAPPVRHGMANPPAPPPGVQDALAGAMALPTRR